MSAETTALKLDAPETTASVESTLTRADSLLETTFLELASALDPAAADNAPDEASPTAGPLGVDLVGELAERSRNHGKRRRPTWPTGAGWSAAPSPAATPTSCGSRRRSSCCTCSR